MISEATFQGILKAVRFIYIDASSDNFFETRYEIDAQRSSWSALGLQESFQDLESPLQRLRARFRYIFPLGFESLFNPYLNRLSSPGQTELQTLYRNALVHFSTSKSCSPVSTASVYRQRLKLSSKLLIATLRGTLVASVAGTVVASALRGTFVASAGCLRYVGLRSSQPVASTTWDLCRLYYVGPWSSLLHGAYALATLLALRETFVACTT